MQLEDWFADNKRHALDDSEFISLLDMVIESFAHVGLAAPFVQLLRRHACELYHRLCQEDEPESTFEANMELMLSYLPDSRRTVWQRSL
jgi:hypothetical protein